MDRKRTEYTCSCLQFGERDPGLRGTRRRTVGRRTRPFPIVGPQSGVRPEQTVHCPGTIVLEIVRRHFDPGVRR